MGPLIMKRFILILTTILSVSCQEKKDNFATQESVTQHAISLMEDGKNSEAIQILKNENEKRPSERVQMLLASAYAGRAGIKVENYWGMIIGHESLIKTPQELEGKNDDLNLEELLGSLSPEIKKSLKGLDTNLYNLQRIQRRITQIPVVKEDQASDLALGIDVLKDTHSEGARLYRAILEVIVIRSSIDQGVQLISRASSGKSSLCTEDFGLAIQWIQYTYALLQDTLSDINVAFPSQKKPVEDIQNQLRSVIEDLPSKAIQARGLLCQRS